MLLHNFCIENRPESDCVHIRASNEESRTVYRDTVKCQRMFREQQRSENANSSEGANIYEHPVNVKSKKRENLLRVILEKGPRRPTVTVTSYAMDLAGVFLGCGGGGCASFSAGWKLRPSIRNGCYNVKKSTSGFGDDRCNCVAHGVVPMDDTKPMSASKEW